MATAAEKLNTRINLELTPKDAELVMVALRRLELLSDESKGKRDRAGILARRVEVQL